MGLPREAPRARLVVGMLSADAALMETVAQELDQTWGPADYVSPTLPFTYTHYYDAELGTPLLRRFVLFGGSFAQDNLASAKLLTNETELRHVIGGRRRLSLDPGYITLGKLVLASTKDQAHRIHLGSGVYAEVTLRYRQGGFVAWPWTYPDYRSPEYLAIFDELRARLAAETRPAGRSEPV